MDETCQKNVILNSYFGITADLPIAPQPPSPIQSRNISAANIVTSPHYYIQKYPSGMIIHNSSLLPLRFPIQHLPTHPPQSQTGTLPALHFSLPFFYPFPLTHCNTSHPSRAVSLPFPTFLTVPLPQDNDSGTPGLPLLCLF